MLPPRQFEPHCHPSTNTSAPDANYYKNSNNHETNPPQLAPFFTKMASKKY